MKAAAPLRIACLTLLGLAASAPCLAESSASSASSAGSASVGSLSDSVTGSSKSSSGDTKVAEGDYRVVDLSDVAEPAGRPGMLRLRLQATAQPGALGELWLTLPREALAQRALVAGDVVSASRRPYGVEFAHTAPREAFFLLLAGDWPRELDPRPVTL